VAVSYFIFINRINTPPQGPRTTIFQLFGIVSGFIKEGDALEKPV
jgi:hypothetical protein